MLAWVEKEVASPYGPVATLHWAVPESASQHSTQPGSGDDADDAATALRLKLEDAEDQLGAVLWNSNTEALNYLHRRIFRLPPVPVYHCSTHGQAPLHGKIAVELGAGVGCLGIALAMAGARVAITDLKELLPLMKHNVELNRRSVKRCSGGVGQCVALQWKWGPTASLSIQKQWRKKSSHATLQSVIEETVKAVLQPSDNFSSCSAALAQNDEGVIAVGEQVKTGKGPQLQLRCPPLSCDYVILCDALYGNPKDWPALLYTLSELLATNPLHCRAINFCEQRVDDVEGAFLKLLDDENTKIAVPAAQRDADPLWLSVVDAAHRCCNSASGEKSSSSRKNASADDAHRLREESTQALLQYCLVQMRQGYRWVYQTEVLQEAQSDLNMTIRATQIYWEPLDTHNGETAAVSSSRVRRRDTIHHGDEGDVTQRKQVKKEERTA